MKQFTWHGPILEAMLLGQLLAKFKFLKQALWKWSNVKYKAENLEILTLKSRITFLEDCAESRPLTDVELSERNEGVQKVMEHARRMVLDFKQKSQIKWTIDGDENSNFFQGYVNNKAMKNRINGLIYKR